MRNDFRYECPDDIKEALWRYTEQRLRPGGFLSAVLANDLAAAAGRADPYNYPRLHGICLYVIGFIPAELRGSYEAVDNWVGGDRL